MNPQFAGIIVPGVDFSLLEPQKHAFFFTDFDSDLRQKRAFSGKVCSLEVATQFEELQFTFSSLVLCGPLLRDTGQGLLSASEGLALLIEMYDREHQARKTSLEDNIRDIFTHQTAGRSHMNRCERGRALTTLNDCACARFAGRRRQKTTPNLAGPS